jgi:hypothetical protein
MKFLPKKKHFCRTITNPGCMYLALGIDSLGYQEYYRRLFIDLGLDMTTVTRTHHIQINNKQNFHSAYVQRPLVKRRRFQDRVEKVLDQNNKLQKDKKKGLVYESRIAGPTVPEPEAEAAAPANKKKSYYHVICLVCKRQGHTTKKSMNCLFSTNEKSKWNKKDSTQHFAGKFVLHVPVPMYLLSSMPENPCWDMRTIYRGWNFGCPEGECRRCRRHAG